MESVEVRMARLEERISAILVGQEKSQAGQDRMSTKLDRMDDSMDDMARRLQKVEEQLASNAPTIEEFITIKTQIKGAGIAGKWLWAAGGFLISIAFTFREQIRDWFLK